MSAPEITTADVLGAFRRELETEGFSEETAEAIVIAAAQNTIHPESFLINHEHLSEKQAG